MCKMHGGKIVRAVLVDQTPGGADMDESAELQSIKTRVVKLLGCEI